MIKIFAEQRLSDFLDERLNRLRQEVQNQDTNYLLNVNETSFIDYLVNRYQVELLVFYWDQISVSYCEKLIPAELFPPSFHVRPGKSYPRQVITYHLPFSGDKELLKCQPSRYIMWTKDIRLEGDCVCFDVINWQDDAEAIKREADNIIGTFDGRLKMFLKKCWNLTVDWKKKLNNLCRHVKPISSSKKT